MLRTSMYICMNVAELTTCIVGLNLGGITHVVHNQAEIIYSINNYLHTEKFSNVIQAVYN